MNTPPYPPDDRFCDLVMKGGITSGIVYPKAIALLSKHYRFKSIGGTSAGATIIGSYMVRGAVEGNEKMMAPGHEVSFGLLRKSAIDQHLDLPVHRIEHLGKRAG